MHSTTPRAHRHSLGRAHTYFAAAAALGRESLTRRAPPLAAPPTLPPDRRTELRARSLARRPSLLINLGVVSDPKWDSWNLLEKCRSEEDFLFDPRNRLGLIIVI